MKTLLLLFAGAFVSLLATYIASITPREVYGARLGALLLPSLSARADLSRLSSIGSVYIFLAVATLVGTPTGGALLRTVDETHFRSLIVFTGALMTAGTVVLCGAAVAARVGVVRLRRGCGTRGNDNDRLRA